MFVWGVSSKAWYVVKVERPLYMSSSMAELYEQDWTWTQNLD